MENVTRGAFSSMDYLLLARVDSLDFYKDNDGRNVLDENGNPIPTGLLNISFLERTGTREKVPFVIPIAGNTQFFGGIPEVGTTCVVGWRQRDMPIIIGFLPYGLANVTSLRETVPNIIPGEVYLQSSILTQNITGEFDNYRGARIWLDRYGRIRMGMEGYEWIAGYMLGDEQTDAVNALNDTITGQPIFHFERLPSGTQRRADHSGNLVQTIGKSHYFRVQENVDSIIQGSLIQTVRGSTTLQDENDNSLQISANGVNLVGATAAVTIQSQGTMSLQSAASHVRHVMNNEMIAVGDDRNDIVGGSINQTVSGSITEEVQTGNWSETVLLGKKTISATTGVTLDGAHIALGSDTAIQPAVLGTQLVSVLNELVTALIASTGTGNLGAPVPLTQSLSLVPIQATLNSILSGKVFVE